MPWWGWVLVGALLLAGELFVVDADFYLVFIGFAALVVGVLGLVGLGGPPWLQFVLFAGIAVASFYFRGSVYTKLRPPAAGLPDQLVGEHVVVTGAIAPGAQGQAELRGSVWQARNAGGTPLAPGARARVESVDGILLNVRADT